MRQPGLRNRCRRARVEQSLSKYVSSRASAMSLPVAARQSRRHVPRSLNGIFHEWKNWRKIVCKTTPECLVVTKKKPSGKSRREWLFNGLEKSGKKTFLKLHTADWIQASPSYFIKRFKETLLNTPCRYQGKQVQKKINHENIMVLL